ncbi:MAG: VWA domain-containing protein [Magnetococcales bacterium]|nr:VWA domain-containing protein [Magnetococcales bacterium]
MSHGRVPSQNTGITHPDSENSCHTARQEGIQVRFRVMVVLLSVIVTLFLISVNASAAVGKQKEPVVPRVEGERSTVRVGERKPYYVLIEFDVVPEEQVSDSARPPINLGLVLDRSGSMRGQGKMGYLKKAARAVVDRLTANDRITIVEYDDRVTLLWPSSPVEAKSLIKRRIDSLQPRGSTNLHGGLMQGIREVSSHYDMEAVNRVLLLSDGLANKGVTQPHHIYRDVHDTSKGKVSVTALGLGLDYNEDLMQGIAENGRGNYYFVESPTQVARIFREELSALSQTVAKDVKGIFQTSDAVTGVHVYGYRASTDGTRTEIPLEDFYAGENRSLLLKLEIDPRSAGRKKLGSFTLLFQDARNEGAPVTVRQDLWVTASASAQEVEESVKNTVLADALTIDADERHEKYVRQFEKGEREAAKANIRKLNQELAVQNTRLKSVKLGKKLEALSMEDDEMDRVSSAPASEMKSYLKAQKQRLYQAKKGKRSLSMMQQGSKGYQVENLQKALKGAGLYNGPVNGVYSPEVGQAVEAFQQQKQLGADGIAGPKTLKELGLY